MSKIRQERTAEQIKLILSDLLLREVSDPRLQGLTITRVLIDRELQHANIYVNALGDDTREQDVMRALEKAKTFFRYELAQRMDLRTVPELHFHWDPTLAYVQEVNDILDHLDIPPEEEAPADDQTAERSDPSS